jgi:hypothetical protein
MMREQTGLRRGLAPAFSLSRFSTVPRHLWMSWRAAAFGFRRRGNLRGVEITQEREIASPKTGSQ